MAFAPCSTSTSSSSSAAARVSRSSTAAAARVARSSAAAASHKKMTCLCSPTNHPGSFRCSRHRNGPAAPGGNVGGEAAVHGASSRGGTGRAAAKGRSVRALLLQRIANGGPGELGRRRRRGAGDFQPRPSRLRACAS